MRIMAIKEAGIPGKTQKSRLDHAGGAFVSSAVSRLCMVQEWEMEQEHEFAEM